MTRIRYKAKPTWHETGLSYEGRSLLVAESPAALLIRRKGTRQALSLPWNLAYLRAATLAATLQRLAKINRRRAVRRGALAVVK